MRICFVLNFNSWYVLFTIIDGGGKGLDILRGYVIYIWRLAEIYYATISNMCVLGNKAGNPLPSNDRETGWWGGGVVWIRNVLSFIFRLLRFLSN